MNKPITATFTNTIIFTLLTTGLMLVVSVLVSAGIIKPASTPDDDYISVNSTDYTGTLPTIATEPQPTWNTYPEDRQLTAKQYFVYDCKARTFLTISGAEDERIYPASITKLFTAYVAMKYVFPEVTYVAGDELDLVAYGSSVAKIQKGDHLTARQLVEGMLLPSGNDASYVLACAAGRVIANDSGMSASAAVQVFMEEMNRQAKALGMKNTHFVNPDGIHDTNHYTSFKDLTILGGLCLENTTIMRNASVAQAEISLHGETITWKNTNEIINPESPYYCPYATGLKTGQTPDAGSCLLSSFYKDGQFLLIGVFGCPEEFDRFDDTLQLFNQTVLY